MEHTFTKKIKEILNKHFGEQADDIYKNSHLLQYLNKKTVSANRGSKARGSFANLYAIYVLVEDYLANDFHQQGDYSLYDGAIYNSLFIRQRQLPFGANLQNHALNNRLNAEFRNLFPILEIDPISRLAESDRYWINENLLKAKISNKEFNIAQAIIEIINEYISTKQESFGRFISSCQELKLLNPEEHNQVETFILSQLAPNVDARLFEIISFSILKFYYFDQKIYWGYKRELKSLKEENLKLFKTGRTNANDGGIDFVMKPLGRFFQVTETLDFKKYFLDIQKLERYPITFVIKTEEEIQSIIEKIRENAEKSYGVKAIVDKYMSCIEDVININILRDRFNIVVKLGYLNQILDEIILQSKIEFNQEDLDSENEEE